MGRARELSKFPKFSEGLALGGGAYLGGTTAANLLDDYEEGTWTPFISVGSGSVAHNVQEGIYTKLGRLVKIQARVSLSSVTSPSGIITIGGLPFSVSSVNIGRISGSILVFAVAGSTNVNSMGTWSGANSTALTVTDENNASLQATSLGSGSQFDITFTYETDA